MCKLLKIYLVTLLFVLVSCSFASAKDLGDEKSEWQDKKYNFLSIHTILILPADKGPYVSNSFANRLVDDWIDEKLAQEDFRNQGIKYLSLDSLSRLIQQNTGINMAELKRNNDREYRKVLLEEGSKYHDAVLAVIIPVWQYSMTKGQIYSFSWTEYQTSYFHAGNVSGNVTTPYTRTQVGGGGTVQMVSAGVSFILYETKTQEPIWVIEDIRHVTNETVFQNTKPEDMAKRIINRSMGKLSKLAQTKN